MLAILISSKRPGLKHKISNGIFRYYTATLHRFNSEGWFRLALPKFCGYPINIKGVNQSVLNLQYTLFCTKIRFLNDISSRR